MRYTECRLAAVTSDMLLADIDANTVEFAPNYDASQVRWSRCLTKMLRMRLAAMLHATCPHSVAGVDVISVAPLVSVIHIMYASCCALLVCKLLCSTVVQFGNAWCPRLL